MEKVNWNEELKDLIKFTHQYASYQKYLKDIKKHTMIGGYKEEPISFEKWCDAGKGIDYKKLAEMNK